MEEAVDIEGAVAGAGFECSLGVGDADVAVAGFDMQIAGEVIERDVAVAGGEAELALEAGDGDVAVGGSGLERELGGGFDGDAGLLTMPGNVEADVGQFFEEEMDLVAGLAFLKAIVAELATDHLDVDADLVAAGAGAKVDAGVGDFEIERGLAGERIGLRPGVVGILRKGGAGGEQRQGGGCQGGLCLHGSRIRKGRGKGS